jgi:hypothetical protein
MTYHTRAYPSGSVKERGTEGERSEIIRCSETYGIP